jgi:hypothetical protein
MRNATRSTTSRPARAGLAGSASSPSWISARCPGTRSSCPISAPARRLYFKIPGGIAFGQHWLNVKFEKSLVRVPFRILTNDEDKMLDKHYGDIEKQVKEAFKPKKKS